MMERKKNALQMSSSSDTKQTQSVNDDDHFVVLGNNNKRSNDNNNNRNNDNNNTNNNSGSKNKDHNKYEIKKKQLKPRRKKNTIDHSSMKKKTKKKNGSKKINDNNVKSGISLADAAATSSQHLVSTLAKAAETTTTNTEATAHVAEAIMNDHSNSMTNNNKMDSHSTQPKVNQPNCHSSHIITDSSSTITKKQKKKKLQRKKKLHSRKDTAPTSISTNKQRKSLTNSDRVTARRQKRHERISNNTSSRHRNNDYSNESNNTPGAYSGFADDYEDDVDDDDDDSIDNLGRDIEEQQQQFEEPDYYSDEDDNIEQTTASCANNNKDITITAHAVTNDDIRDQVRQEFLSQTVQATNVTNIMDDGTISRQGKIIKNIILHLDGKRKLQLLLLLTICGSFVIAMGVTVGMILSRRNNGSTSIAVIANSTNGTTIRNISTEDAKQLLEFLKLRSLDDGEALSNVSSPQYSAFLWLTTDEWLIDKLSKGDDNDDNGNDDDQQEEQPMGQRLLGQVHQYHRQATTTNNDTSVDNTFGADLYKSIYVDEILERYAMVTLYYSTTTSRNVDENGTPVGWKHSLNWLSELHICNWGKQRPNMCTNSSEGTTDIKSLQTLILGRNKLQGSLPKELGLLTNLYELLLNENQLTGTIPRSLNLLTEMKYFDIARNNFDSQPIPIDIFYTMKGIKAIRLPTNNFIGTLPTSLGSLINLETLDVSYNSLTGTVPSELGSLSSLSNLQLEGNDFHGIIGDEICSLQSSPNDEQYYDLYFGSDCRRHTGEEDGEDEEEEIVCRCCSYCCNKTGNDCVENERW